MTERPILFSGPMVRAVLEDRKTQTRRFIRVAQVYTHTERHTEKYERVGKGYITERGGRLYMPCGDGVGGAELEPLEDFCPYGEAGDQLWVRETWRCFGGPEYEYQKRIQDIRFRADADLIEAIDGAWKPSIFMPRWASRTSLVVAETKVQHLQDISEEDAKAEGVAFDGKFWRGGAHKVKGTPKVFNTAKEAFQDLWDSINGKRAGAAWADNPWVWAVTFKRVQP